jgi:hypothetical protein
MKYWCLSFRGASQHNYARECAEVLLKWKYELDDMLRKALEQSINGAYQEYGFQLIFMLNNWIFG